jgi:hypothetical protein
MDTAQALELIGGELHKHKDRRDTAVFQKVALALQAHADIPFIVGYGTREHSSLQTAHIANAILVKIEDAEPTVTAAVALALCGEQAKDDLLRLIQSERVPMVRFRMVKEAAKMNQPWLLDVLLALHEIQDAYMPGQIRMIVRDNPVYAQRAAERGIHLKPH